MTLIIYAQCRDATIIISDRLDSGREISQDVKKYYRPRNNNYILALSGPSDVIVSLLRHITRDQSINSLNVIDKILAIVFANSRSMILNDITEGFILVRNGSSFEFNSVEIKPPEPIIGPAETEFRCIGDPEARGIANNFLSKRNLRDMDLGDAIQYLIAIMLETSNTVARSVGGITLGFDILVLFNNGDIKECSPYRSSENKKISTDFEPDSSKNFDHYLQSITTNSTEENRE